MGKLKWLFLIAAFLALPMAANAGIIGNVSLTEYSYYPAGNVSYPSGAAGSYYLDYQVSINGGGQVEAFCVEDSNSPPNTQTYTLLTVDSGLADFGLIAQNYMAAAWIAENYLASKPGAQIAIWEVVFDGVGNLDLGDGGFQSTSYVTDANAILAAVALQNGFSASSQWYLAVNPTVAQGGTISTSPYQNYLVPTPIPGAVWLLGSGLLGLVAVRRRRK